MAAHWKVGWMVAHGKKGWVVAHWKKGWVVAHWKVGCITARGEKGVNGCNIWQQAAHTAYKLSTPIFSTRAVENNPSLNEKPDSTAIT